MNELTRAELIEKICLTDATYDCGQGNCSSSCDKCEDVLNYFLDRYDAKVRADAIEEIATRLEAELLMVMPRDKVKFIMYKVHTVLEQLKEK